MATAPKPIPTREAVPTPEDGDRLARAESGRRHDAMSHVNEAELIGGVVSRCSPASGSTRLP